MEAARSLLSSPSPFSHKTHIRNCSSSSSSSSSVLMLHEQIAPALAPVPVPRNNCRLSMRSVKEEHTSVETLDRMQREAASSAIKDDDTDSSEQSIKFTQERLPQWPSILHIYPPKEEVSAYMTSRSLPIRAEKLINIEPRSVEALAKQASLATKHVASLDADSNLIDDPLKEGKIIRSTRLLERRSKRRIVTSKFEVPEMECVKKVDMDRKVEEFEQKDHVHMFLSGPEAKQLLTAKEESELVLHIQDLVKLEKAKVQFQKQFGREPRLAEWAKVVGISQQALLSKLHFGNRSRERLINANLRMVVHIARQYQGRGLPLEDMLQAGSIGLMQSVDKCKPQVDSRFGTYAYWWIRQAVRKAIFKHSRSIRLPENVYTLISKLNEARKSCIQEGNLYPREEEIASRAGMSVEKMQLLLSITRPTVSLEQTVWDDDPATYQEVTPDDSIDPPELSVSKQVMRGQVHSLLKVLNPRERKIIRMRFGMTNGREMSLTEIGYDFGLTRERIRQLYVKAVYKLKQNLHSQGLDAYNDLLI